MTEVEIRPLTPDRWRDVAALFGEGGDPKWCWCMWWRLRAKDFSAARVVDHRAGLERLTAEAMETGRPAPGLVAYRDGRAVGWVTLGPRDDFERLRRSKVIPAVDDRPVWSVVCFVVSESVRGTHLMRRLLEAAIGYAREHGAEALEAYPIDTRDEGFNPADLFPGTLGTFTVAGFRVVGQRLSQGGATRHDRPIVRLELGDSRPGDSREVPAK